MNDKNKREMAFLKACEMVGVKVRKATKAEMSRGIVLTDGKERYIVNEEKVIRPLMDEKRLSARKDFAKEKIKKAERRSTRSRIMPGMVYSSEITCNGFAPKSDYPLTRKRLRRKKRRKRNKA